MIGQYALPDQSTAKLCRKYFNQTYSSWCRQLLIQVSFSNNYNKNMAANSQKNKVVENYLLESISYTNPDESEVWVARHKVLKKSYLLKKIKYVRGITQETEKGECEDAVHSLNLQRIIRQIELLKTIKVSDVPKCQKMIKTTNNVYVVYDEYSGKPLAQMLKTHNLSNQQKIGIMLLLASKLKAFHIQQVIFLQLSSKNIFVRNNQHLYFSQWSLCIYKNNSNDIFPINNAKKFQCIANQVTQQSIFSTASDIFSLGKIFAQIIHCKINRKGIDFPQQILQLIVQMIERKPENRPKLQQIIRVLEKSKECIILRAKSHSIRQIKSNKDLTQTQISTQITLQTQTQQGKSNLFLNHSPSLIRQKQSPQLKDMKTCKSIGAISFNNILTGMSRIVSQTNISRAKNSNQILAQKIIKHRNLSFFIVALSDFAMKWPQGECLSFLLLKQSSDLLNSCLLEWQNQAFRDKKSGKMQEILMKEANQLRNCVETIKQYYLSKDADSQFQTQLRSDAIMSEKYYKEQIIHFCDEFMKQTTALIRQDKVSSFVNLVNDLFSVYMILKRIEQGSFEKYWERIYSSEYAFIKNQKYLNEVKKLGYRYLKSKIAEILATR